MMDGKQKDDWKSEWEKKYGYHPDKGPDGPAVWTSPEPPSDYTYHPIDTEALRKLLTK